MYFFRLQNVQALHQIKLRTSKSRTWTYITHEGIRPEPFAPNRILWTKVPGLRPGHDWRSFCSWKTPNSWLVTIKWPLQTPMLVVVLMMINPHFLMLKSAILKLCQLLHFESLHCFKFRFLSRFVLSPLGPNVYKQVWDRKQSVLRLFASPTYLWKRPHLKQFQRLIAIFEAFSQINLIRDIFEKVQDLSFWIVLCSPR